MAKEIRLDKAAEKLGKTTDYLLFLLDEVGHLVENGDKSKIPIEVFRKLRKRLGSKADIFVGNDNKSKKKKKQKPVTGKVITTNITRSPLIKESSTLDNTGRKENKPKEPGELSREFLEDLNCITRSGAAILSYLEFPPHYELLPVKWSEITFEKNVIKGKFYKRSFIYLVPGVRASFNVLREYLDERKVPGPELLFDWKLRRFLEIRNWDKLFDILRLARLVRSFHLGQPKKGKFFKTQEEFRNIDNRVIVKLFKGDRKEQIHYLLNKQDRDLKIVPIVEPVYQRNRLVSLDDSFLFSVRLGFYVFVVWESIKTGKATHIFRMAYGDYHKFLVNIESYILSHTDYKRATLHQIPDQLKRVLGYVGSVNHRDPERWKVNLESKLRG